jgi:hypothetical protein
MEAILDSTVARNRTQDPAAFPIERFSHTSVLLTNDTRCFTRTSSNEHYMSASLTHMSASYHSNEHCMSASLFHPPGGRRARCSPILNHVCHGRSSSALIRGGLSHSNALWGSMLLSRACFPRNAGAAVRAGNHTRSPSAPIVKRMLRGNFSASHALSGGN